MNMLDLGCGLAGSFEDATHYLDYSCGDEHRLNLFKNYFSKRGKQYIDWNMENIPFPFESNFFGKVYMRHSLEHFYKYTGESILKEINRIMSMDGEFYVEVPDIEWLASQIVKNPDLDQKPEHCGWTALSFMYGDGENYKCPCCNKNLGLHIHKCGYTNFTLSRLLDNFGFQVLVVDRGMDIDMKIISKKVRDI